MNRQASRAVDVTRATVRAVRSDQITFIAASLAYYAFISLLPLLLLAIVAAGVFGGSELAADLAGRAAGAFGEQAGDAVREALTSAGTQGGATALGLVVLLWSGLKLFRGLDVAFSTVYGAPLPDGIVEQLRDALVTLGGVGLGIAVTVALGVFIARVDVVVGPIDLANLAGTALLVAGLTAAFFPLYYVLPARGVTPREALPGAVFAAVGWTALQTGFRVYASTAGAGTYGVLGAALLLVTFCYFGGLILLVGVVLNAVAADRIGGEGIETELGHTDRQTDDTTGSMSDDTTPRDLDLEIDTEELDDEELRRAVEGLRDDLAEFEERIDDRTVHRDEVRRELKGYVRSRVRRGKARGWGPYLVLLYGTAMTLGAFFFLNGLVALAAMFVIWLSTLGLYVLMLLVGVGVSAARAPGRLKNRVDEFRS